MTSSPVDRRQRQTRASVTRAAIPAFVLCDWELATDALRTASFVTYAVRSQWQSYAIHVALLCDFDDSWMTVQAIDQAMISGVTIMQS
jgi:hypothetical protein